MGAHRKNDEQITSGTLEHGTLFEKVAQQKQQKKVVLRKIFAVAIGDDAREKPLGKDQRNWLHHLINSTIQHITCALDGTPYSILYYQKVIQ